VGLWESPAEVERIRKVDRRFRPRLRAAERDALYQGWTEAIRRIRTSSRA